MGIYNGSSTGQGGKPLPRVRIIIDAMAREEWLDYLRKWQRRPTARKLTIQAVPAAASAGPSGQPLQQTATS